MKLLLDSHVLLWWLMDDKALTERARRHIAAPENLVFVSAASVWELRIKQSIGKLTLPDSFAEILAAEAFESLSVTAAHAHAVGRLPLHHRDPFDRILVAQAKTEHLTLLTHDRDILPYDVDCLMNQG